MGKIVGILNNKGGVAKTTSVCNIGEILSDLGKKVLVIDLDSQMNLTTLLSCRSEEKIGTRTILQAFRERKDLPTYKVKKNLYLTPSSKNFASIDTELSGVIGRERILSDLLEPMRVEYDFILLDCPPSMGQVAYNCLLCSDEVYIPVIPETLPYMGLNTIEEMCNIITTSLRVDKRITGIFLTRYEKGNLSKIVEESIRSKYGDIVFKTLIRKNIAIAQAPLAKMSLKEYAPTSNGYKDYLSLSKELIKRNK